MPASGASAGRPSDFNGQPTSKNKPMPQNIEAEQSVLAACMLNQDAVEELVLKLKPENFYRPASPSTRSRSPTRSMRRGSWTRWGAKPTSSSSPTTRSH